MAKIDLEAVNRMRALNNLEPLTELPEEGGVPAGPAAKTPEEIEAERKLNNPDPLPPVGDDDIDDEKLLALLAKKGIKADSLESLKPKDPDEDAAVTADRLENDKITFGLNKGMFNRKTYDNYVVDSREPMNLVYNDYYDEAKKDDPSLTDEDIRAEFDIEFGLDADKTSRKYIRGQKMLAESAKKLLNQKYGKILALDSEFDSHVASKKADAERKKNIIAKTPQYKKDVESVFENLKKITTKFSDTESYEVQVLDEDISAIRDRFLTSEVAEGLIENGYTVDQIQTIAYNGLLQKSWPTIAHEISKQAILKHQKGVKGIPPVEGKKNELEGEDNLTDAQRAYRAEYDAQKAKDAAKKLIPATN